MDLFSDLYSIEFCSFGSGSSGNCYYVGHCDGALLIDIGLSIRRITKSLHHIGRGFHQIKAVLLTHTHTDHIAGLETLLQKHPLNIYGTNEVLQSLTSSTRSYEKHSQLFVELVPGKSFTLAGFRITAFRLDHDCEGTVGYFIQNSQSSLALATDLGYINNDAHAFLQKADILVLESNYDSLMLANGPYPPTLKKRIISRTGHLANEHAADYVARYCTKQLKHLFLAHLSKENNHPDRVREAFGSAFEIHRFDQSKLITFKVLEQEHASSLYRF